MKTLRFIWILCFLLTVIGRPSYSCTIVMATGPGIALAGSNEDSSFPLTLLWFTPASEGSYARVTLGYKLMVNSVQGGMNEKGLFVDGNSLGGQGWKADETKSGLMVPLMDYILARCADVEEVKELFRQYNIPALNQARIPVMDQSGASMVVEWYQGQVVFLEPDQSYQVATNFVGSAYTNREKPCWRYNNAVEILDKEATYSLGTVRNALEASHQESENSRTVYSFICDLKKGEIYVYNYHDFSNTLKFKLDEELKKGHQEHYLGQLFQGRSPEYLKFLDLAPAKMVETGYQRNIQFAMMFYQNLKSQYPIAYKQQITYHTLSQVGQVLLDQNRTRDAITFLERNTKEFPDSEQVHFELASAYLLNRQEEKALEEFKKTLSLNPDHKGARQALDKLQGPR